MRILILVLVLLSFISAPIPAFGETTAATSSGPQEINYFSTDDSDFIRKYLKPGTFMRADEVKPGMEGYGLSVFRGTKIERFHVKVIGVMRRVINGKDAILVRLSGPAIGKNNVIRGMSGSPVYIDDKLIGAVSYGFDFSMEPIAGVTPIVEMLDAVAKPREVDKANNTNKIGLAPAKARLTLSPSMITSDSDELRAFRRRMVATSAPRMVPLVSPVSLSGFSQRAQEFLKKRFESVGLSVADGTGGGLNSDLSQAELKEANNLRPGSAMGVMLTTGDFESASTGTLTARFGDQLVGFGHPFVQAGPVDFPMTSAIIHDVLPSLSISFKLSSPVSILGNVYSDRPWAVGAQIAAKSKMVPVTIEVTDVERRIRRKFSSRVIDHEDLTPELVAACAMSAVDATYQSSAPYVARIATRVDLENAPAIQRFDCLSNGTGSASATSVLRPFFSDPVSGNIYSITSRILGNRYSKTSLKNVDMKIELDTGRSLTRIVRVATDKPVVKPGDNLRLSCQLEPYNKELYSETIDITIPRDAPDGDLVIGVSGGSQFDELRRRMNLSDPPSTSLVQIVKRIQERPRGDRLFAVLALPEQAIHIDGEVLQSPPGHWNKLFFSNRYTHGPTLVNGERRISKELESLVDGIHILAVTVKRPDAFMERSPWYVATAEGSGRATMGAYVTTQAQKAIDNLSKSDSKIKVPDGVGVSGSSDSAGVAKTTGLSLFSPSSQDTHIRPVQVWSQNDDAAFKGGTRNGVIVDNWGRMFPGFAEKKSVGLDGALRAWSSVWSQGSLYVATSNKVLRYSPGAAAPSEVAKFDCVAIPALAAGSKGQIFAALAPGGRIWAIDGKGRTSEVTRLDSSLITCLAFDNKENLFAGVAGDGKVYKVSKDGSASVFFDSGQAHVLSLFFDVRNGRLYVACGESGEVYSLGPGGDARAELHVDEHLVTGVCRSARGDLFVTTAGEGHLYRVTRQGEVSDLATSQAFYTLFYHADSDSVFAGDAEGDITQIVEEPLTGQSFFVPVKHTEQEAVVSFSSDGAGTLYALTSNLPSILSFQVKADGASFVSPVKDAGRTTHWSLLNIFGSFNEVSSSLTKSVAVETRTGECARPDLTWSAWTQATPSNEGFQVQSKSGRYFQYRLKWLDRSSEGGTTFPNGRDSVVGRVTVTYLPTNIHPRFTAVSLMAGSYLSDSEDITVTTDDPDGDSLALDVDVSKDGGKSWMNLVADLRSEPQKGKVDSKTDKKSSDATGKSSDSSDTSSDTKDKSGARVDVSGGGENPSGSGDTEDGDKSDEMDDSAAGSDDSGESKAPSIDPDDSPDSNSSVWKDPRYDLAGDGSQLQAGDGDEDTPSKNKKKPSEDGPKAKVENKADDTKKKKTTAKDGKNTEKPESTKTKKPVSESPQPTKFNWPLLSNTLKDGHHILRFTVSDAPSNLVYPESMQCYRSVVIDNTKPVISGVRVELTRGHLLQLDLKAADETSPIVNATFQVDKEEPRAFAVKDGLADRKNLALGASGIIIRKGTRKVVIEVVDKAGNKATKSIKLSSLGKEEPDKK